MNRHHRLVLLHHKILSGWQKTRRKTKNECKRGPGWKDDGDGIIHIASFYFFSLKLRKEERGGWKKETKAKKTCSIAAINYAGMMWLSWHVQQRIIKARWSDKGLSPIFFICSQSLVSLLGISMATMKVLPGYLPAQSTAVLRRHTTKTTCYINTKTAKYLLFLSFFKTVSLSSH